MASNIFKGLKGIMQSRVAKELIKKYRDQGMNFIEAVIKGNNEANEIIIKKKLNFIKDKMYNTNIFDDNYVKLIDKEIELTDPELFKDIKQFEKNNRPELADKMRALRHPDWAEANFGEDYIGVLEQKQNKGIKGMMEKIDPNIKERTFMDDIDDMNEVNIDEFFGDRKKNAKGGLIDEGVSTLFMEK